MKKQAYYLPNLNSLLLQNHSYSNHKQRLKDCKSQYKIRYEQNEAEGTRKEHLLVKLIPAKHITQRGNHQSHQGDLLRMNRNYKVELSPFQKRKYSEMSRENQRIHRAMHILSPTIERYSKQNEQAHEMLKERISKFVKEGSKISYKFKKSLIEVERRKKKKDEYYCQRSNELREEAKVQLSSLIEKSMKLRKSQEKIEQEVDLLYVDVPQIKPKKSGSKLKLEQIVKRSMRPFSPTNLNINSNIQKTNEEKMKTEANAPFYNQQFLTKHRQLINKKIFAYHPLYQRDQRTIQKTE